MGVAGVFTSRCVALSTCGQAAFTTAVQADVESFFAGMSHGSATRLVVRCIAPNKLCLPDRFDSVYVLQQLTAFHSVQFLQWQRTRFPCQQLNVEFLATFWPLVSLPKRALLPKGLVDGTLRKGYVRSRM